MSEASIVSDGSRGPEHGSCRLVVVGMLQEMHVGASLARAAERLGIHCIAIDAAEAWAGRRILRSFNWRFRDRKPLKPREFSEKLFRACRSIGADVVLGTGIAPLAKSDLATLRSMGIVTINYSTDDPWNPAHFASWHCESLPFYDLIFTPRVANLEDFAAAGCRHVSYLPFAYDDRLATDAEGTAVSRPDILFAGGADEDRVAFMRSFLAQGAPLTLVGAYWDRQTEVRWNSLGVRPPEELAALTRAAKVNLCLVRRANRDGHVMRTFEIAACGGCMLAEDTPEHRELLGPDGDCVRYFKTASDAARVATTLLDAPAERSRMAAALSARICGGGHAYTDRLRSMLGVALQMQAGTRRSSSPEAELC